MVLNVTSWRSAPDTVWSRPGGDRVDPPQKALPSLPPRARRAFRPAPPSKAAKVSLNEVELGQADLREAPRHEVRQCGRQHGERARRRGGGGRGRGHDYLGSCGVAVGVGLVSGAA